MGQLRGTIFQSFHWYSPNDGNFWNEWADRVLELKEKGFTALWLPPAYKGWRGVNDVGYGVYDLFDCGEFYQKGSTCTKYGTKDEYQNCIDEAHKAGLQIYADVVLNHKMGADYKQWVNNVVVVSTPDVVLVCHRSKLASIKELLQSLRRKKKFNRYL